MNITFPPEFVATKIDYFIPNNQLSYSSRLAYNQAMENLAKSSLSSPSLFLPKGTIIKLGAFNPKLKMTNCNLLYTENPCVIGIQKQMTQGKLVAIDAGIDSYTYAYVRNKMNHMSPEKCKFANWKNSNLSFFLTKRDFQKLTFHKVHMNEKNIFNLFCKTFLEDN